MALISFSCLLLDLILDLFFNFKTDVTSGLHVVGKMNFRLFFVISIILNIFHIFLIPFVFAI